MRRVTFVPALREPTDLWKSFGSNKLNATAGSMLCVKHMLGTWDEEF